MVQIPGIQDLTGGPFCAKHGETDHRRPILDVLGRNVPCRRCFTIWDHQYQSVPEQYPISGLGPHLGPHLDPFGHFWYHLASTCPEVGSVWGPFWA